jgi:hypothetical protein
MTYVHNDVLICMLNPKIISQNLRPASRDQPGTLTTKYGKWRAHNTGAHARFSFFFHVVATMPLVRASSYPSIIRGSCSVICAEPVSRMFITNSRTRMAHIMEVLKNSGNNLACGSAAEITQMNELLTAILCSSAFAARIPVGE